jgi:antitoxin ParD1/3/4
MEAFAESKIRPCFFRNIFASSFANEKGLKMTITLELPPEVQATLQTKIARRDAESVRQILADVFAPTVEALLRQKSTQMSDDEFEAVADKLADEWAASVKPNAPALSDYAVSRAGIYGGHP